MNESPNYESIVRQTLAEGWPGAVDRSALTGMEFNRSLDQKLGLADWIGRPELEANRFVTDVRIELTSTSSVVFERNTFSCGRVGYFRASLRMGPENGADRIVETAMAELTQWIRSRGALREFRIQSQVLPNGSSWIEILCLIDPTPLGLIHQDDRGRAVVERTRIRVSDLVAASRAFRWFSEELRTEHEPVLTDLQILAAFAHYHQHRDAIDDEIQKNSDAIESARADSLVTGQPQ